MITLYKKNEEDFFHNGICILTDCIVAEVTESLNNSFELYLEYPITGIKFDEIEEERIIKTTTPSGEQLFTIYKILEDMDVIKIYCRHIFYDLLDNFLEDIYIVNKSGTGALQHILSNTQYQHKFTCISDISELNNSRIIRKNPVEALISDDENSFINRWGGELERDNFIIKMLRRRGTDRGVTIQYGKNLIGIEKELNMDSVTTRILPLGYDGLMLPEKYVDSHYIGNYKNPKIKPISYTHIKAQTDDNQSDDAMPLNEAYEALRVAAENEFKTNKIDIPLVNYKVNFIELSNTEEYKNYAVLEKIYLGDTVTIKHEKLNIDIKARAISYSWDSIDNKYIEIELGNFKNNFMDTINKIESITSNVEEMESSILKEAKDNATKLITNGLKDSYVLVRKNEILVMDTPDINTSIKVWRWNKNGLGYSSTGYNGEFGLAMTIDGAIVADFITTGILNAGLIKTGTLESEDSSVSINLSNGAFKIGGNENITEHTNQYSRYKKSDGTFVEISSEGLMHVDGGSKKEYHYLMEGGVINPADFESYEKKIILPDKFKDKDFKVICSLRSASATAALVGVQIWAHSFDYSEPSFYIHSQYTTTGTNNFGTCGVSYIVIA